MPARAKQGGQDVGLRLERLATVPLSLPLEASANTDPSKYEWVNIIPLADLEGRINARDGRKFILDDATAFVARSNAAIKKTGPQPVDKDHAMYRSWNGGGPALGWAEEYELRADGVYARTEWLPEGANLIASRQYRYTSSNIRCELVNVVRDKWGFIEDFDLRMVELAGFTLTNIPALEVISIFSEQPVSQRTSSMDITELLALLGLPATATKEEFLSAVQRRLASSASSEPSLDRFVPRAEHDALKAKLAEAEGQIAAQVEAAAKAARAAEDAEREQLLNEALKTGKVLPATAEYHRKQMAQPGGIQNFREYLAAAPVLGGPVNLAKPTGNGNDNATATLSDAELEVCRQTGVNPDDFLKTKMARLKPT